ncbi:MAG: DUF3240 family protein [Rhodocyclaceae bacterium]|nr:DUF3240 family protein [Rhodocyclaceae bacterium]
MTKRLDACLKLILPNALKDQILDQLLKHPDLVGPFITHRVEGHGDPDSIASEAEQVRGRAERVQIEILMDARHVQDLLAQLRADLCSSDVVWWLSPVTESGSLA